MNTDSLSRIVNMLHCLPASPVKTTTQAVYDELQNRGTEVSLRTIQRDLLALYQAGNFGIELDDRVKPYGWSFSANWRKSTPSLMPFQTAIQFMLFRHVLETQFSESELLPLKHYFDVAEKVVQQTSQSKLLSTVNNAGTQTDLNRKKQAILILALVKKRKIKLTINRKVTKKNDTKLVVYPNAEVWQVDFKQTPTQYGIRFSDLGTKVHFVNVERIEKVELSNSKSICDTSTLTKIIIKIKCLSCENEIRDYLEYHQLQFKNSDDNNEWLIIFYDFAQIWRFIVFAMGKIKLLSPNWVCRRVKLNLASLSLCLD